MVSRVLLCFLLAVAIASVDCNLEGDILHSWKTILVDPNNVLASWNRTDPNPCIWFHVTCNSENLVTRLDLGNAGLSGPIIPALANLTSLQYLELYQNKFYGSIPSEFGHLSKLVSLDLYQNHLSGSIPETFGHFDSLRYLRVFHNNLSGPIPMSLGNLTSLQILKLNKNRLTGTLPVEVIQIVRFGNLGLLDVSNNLLAGTVPRSNSTGTPEQIRIPNKLILEKIIPSGSTVTFSAASVLRLQKSYKIQELRTKSEESDEHEVEEDNLC